MRLTTDLAGDGRPLSDLFKFLSDLEYNAYLATTLKDAIDADDRAKIYAILTPYDLSPEIKDLIATYRTANNMARLKDECTTELDRMKDILGLC